MKGETKVINLVPFIKDHKIANKLKLEYEKLNFESKVKGGINTF
jgi:hypothetical protein